MLNLSLICHCNFVKFVDVLNPAEYIPFSWQFFSCFFKCPIVSKHLIVCLDSSVVQVVSYSNACSLMCVEDSSSIPGPGADNPNSGFLSSRVGKMSSNQYAVGDRSRRLRSCSTWLQDGHA